MLQIRKWNKENKYKECQSKIDKRNLSNEVMALESEMRTVPGDMPETPGPGAVSSINWPNKSRKERYARERYARKFKIEQMEKARMVKNIIKIEERPGSGAV